MADHENTPQRILVLDDEDTIRYVLATLLAETGHEIVAVGTVKEALARLSGERFIAAMLDLVLPDGRGTDVLEAIKASSPETEVIIMTSHASVETAVDALRAGAYDYVHKPFELDLVLATMRRALEKHALQANNKRLMARFESHNRDLADAVKRLASLHAAGAGMSTIEDLPRLLDFLLDLVVRELDVERASIMLLEGGTLKIAAARGIAPDIVRDARVGIGEGVAGRVVETGSAMLVGDVAADAGVGDAVLGGQARQPLSNTFISAPITMAVPIKTSAVLGVVNVTNRRSGEPFGDQDLEHLSALAGQAAIAIERARHLAELRATVDSLTATQEKLEVANRGLHEANVQLEEASRLKSEFLANTSHELRTPLNGILGFLRLVMDGMCDTREEEREFLKNAHECARHLLGLINDVLDIAKIEAGKLTLDIEAVDVRTLFGEVRTITHVQAAQRGLALEFEVVEPCDHAVRGDFGKVKQVLVNLVGNSLKFTEKGKVTVRATTRAELGHVVFEIVDTGIGIAAERQRLVFEKFAQADGSTTRRYGGTGLGLTICRGLVEQMGGIIGVESGGIGAGTRMYFSLPIWRGVEEGDAPGGHTAAVEGPADGALVLVVEDDLVFRTFLTALLTRHGLRVLPAPDADAGWRLAVERKPDLMVVDYALTTADSADLKTGWDLAQRMSERPETRNIPVVFVTGFDAELRDRLRSTAFARKPATLAKPVEADELVRQIEAVLHVTDDRPIRLLLADDDPAMAAILSRLLRKPRFTLHYASGGAECLRILRTQAHGFDMLLLDLMMPEVSGYDVLREMTLSGVAANLPVMVLTANPEPRDEEERRLLQGGEVIAVMSKTDVHTEHDRLPALIQRHLAKRRPRIEPPDERKAA
jgi:signal transduction histidine kinase/DNA-binding response OmpR family regulator